MHEPSTASVAQSRNGMTSHGLGLLVHSAYSLLRAVLMPDQWVEIAARAGYRIIALADWGNLYGALPFLEAAEARGLRAVLGAELAPALPVDVRERSAVSRVAGHCASYGDIPPTSARMPRLVALCEDLCGYRNLAHLLSLVGGGVVRCREKGRGSGVLLSALEGNADGLVLLSDDPGVLEWLRELLPGESVGALVSGLDGSPPHEVELRHAASRLGIQAVAIPEATMRSVTDWPLLRLLGVIRRRGLLGSSATGGERAAVGATVGAAVGAAGGCSTRSGWASPLPDPADLLAQLRRNPGPLQAGRMLLERCCIRRADICSRTFIFPRVGGANGRGMLRSLCQRGLHSRGLERSLAARRRLEKELAVIEQLGFVDYFLATTRIIDWAHRQGIPVVGRGSGVASLAAYLLRITNVDPIRYGLYFERFLHPLRRDYPDLDIDIAWDRRDEVITYVLKAFGEDRAAMIGTHQFFRPRGAFWAAARSLGLDDEKIRHARRGLPGWDLVGSSGGQGTPPAGNDEGAQRLRRLQRNSDPAIRRAAHMALGLHGLPRGIGIHAGGVVLSDGPLSRIVPLERSANGVTITQFEMRGVEKVGLIKIDLLGNRALATLGEASKAAAGGAGIDLVGIAHDDSRTAALLSRGQTIGCFQIESPAMRSLLRQLRACDMGGVTAALALVRPGPSSSGMKSEYAKRMRGAHSPPPIHTRVAGVLELTYGVPLYDEDVMRLIAAVTGVGHAEADMLRRAIRTAVQTGAGRIEESLSALKQGFLVAANERVGKQAAEAVWGELVRLGSYAFCKAHAAGYGVLAYRTAYLKAHYPGPFFAALLNHHHGMYPVRVYVDEARRTGLHLRPPCIHRSRRGWRWEARTHPGLLRCGLAQVRGLRSETVDRILAARPSHPFRSLADFASRVRPNAAELEALLLAGAFDKAFGQVRGELIWRMRKWLRAGQRRGSPFGRNAPRQGRLALVVPLVAERPSSELGAPGTGEIFKGPWRDISPKQRARLERRILGMSLVMHPVQLLPAPECPGVVTPIASLSPGPEMVVLQGIVSAVRRFKRDDGVALLFFTLEDETGLLECIARGSRTLRDIGSLEVHHFVRVEGVLHDALGARSLRAERVRVLGSY